MVLWERERGKGPVQEDYLVFTRNHSETPRPFLGLAPHPQVLAAQPVSVCDSLVSPSCILLAELCSILLAAKLIACQRLVQVWPRTDKRRGSACNRRENSQGSADKDRGAAHRTARKMGHCVKKKKKTKGILPFIKIYPLNSLSQRSAPHHWHSSGQQTVWSSAR